jgi:hypothetical protein
VGAVGGAFTARRTREGAGFAPSGRLPASLCCAQVQYPGYSETEKTVRHEITMWITRQTAELAWIGIGEVIDPSSPAAVRKEVVDMVVPELEHQHLIPPL